MTSYERWSLLVSLGSFVVSVVAFGALAWQLRMLAQATRFDHDRRRTQATLEYLSATMDRRGDLRERGIPDDRDTAGVTALVNRGLAGEVEAIRLITEYLAIFNYLAVAAQADAFDPKIIDQARGGTVAAVQRNYRPWIDEQRERFGEPLLYKDLDWLAAQMTSRSAPPPNGTPAPQV
ncbi:DUF4760 domain-containing protein [Streptomyces sp. 7N604]|uniref:DUF4760 domain-containing protein n=1 Tax=Streptomyces sp. 7N604 TaxID=3457415 RepID=UPI003FD37639